MQLKDTLNKCGAQALLGREKSICYLHKEQLFCDYYDFLQNSPQAMCEFQGCFMEEYSWAEPGMYELQEKKWLKQKSTFPASH